MRETNLNKPIARGDVKVGDRIEVSRDVVVTAVRESTISGGFGEPRIPVTIVSTDSDTLLLATKEKITLLERDKPSEIVIPASATHIFWQDTDGYDYYARREGVTGEWISSEDHTIKYTTDALINEIEDPSGDFGVYKRDSFQVLKSSFLRGGVISRLSEDSMASLRNAMGSHYVIPSQVSRNILPNFMSEPR